MVLEHCGRFPSPAVAIAPFLERDQHGQQVAPSIGKEVLVAWGVGRVPPPLNDPGLLQVS
jgi:hypothetical protein